MTPIVTLSPDKKRQLVEKTIEKWMAQAEALEAEGKVEEAKQLWEKAERWMDEKLHY